MNFSPIQKDTTTTILIGVISIAIYFLVRLAGSSLLTESMMLVGAVFLISFVFISALRPSTDRVVPCLLFVFTIAVSIGNWALNFSKSHYVLEDVLVFIGGLWCSVLLLYFWGFIVTKANKTNESSTE